MDDQRVVVLRLTAEEVANFREGANLHDLGTDRFTDRFIVWKPPAAAVDNHKDSAAATIRVCRNICQHQQGAFAKPLADIEDSANNVLKCTYHGWKLDCSTMCYTEPTAGVTQPELVVEPTDDGGWVVWEAVAAEPWEPSLPRQQLQPGELTITYLSHACVQIKLGPLTMVTDPWLLGPSFLRGWWLEHEPPPDAIERVANADFVYISHSHSDHLNMPTLRAVAERNPEMPVYVGKLGIDVWAGEPESLPFPVYQLPLGQWQPVGEHGRFMILPDGTFPAIDTCCLIEYKGHRIFNSVDCCAPNKMVLPQVDVLLCDFAGGASGFPVCFEGGRYTQSWIDRFIRSERKKLLDRRVTLCQKTAARLFVPFAGYFVEAHPDDSCVRRNNYKNSPQAAIEAVEAACGNTKGWQVAPGATWDCSTGMELPQLLPLGETQKREWQFEPFCEEIDESLHFAPLSTVEGVQFYFDWAGFKGYDLVLHVQETDNTFDCVLREYFIDFLSGRVSEYRPSRQAPRTRFRARAGPWRNTMQHGLNWDGVYIGFQLRISRAPDTYHMQLWKHMFSLPSVVPAWHSFEMEGTTPLVAPNCGWATANATAQLRHVMIAIVLVASSFLVYMASGYITF